MEDKKADSKQTIEPETSRRTFLKTGAAVAGAAMLGTALKATNAIAGDQTKKIIEQYKPGRRGFTVCSVFR